MNEDATARTGENDELHHEDSPSTKSRSNFPPWWAWTVLIVTFTAVVVLQARVDEMDQTNVLITCAILGLIGIGAMGGWFALLSGFPAAVRWSFLAIVIAACATVFSVFRIASFDGGLFPTLRYRWEVAADRLLEVPADLKNQGEDVELSATTDNDFPQFLGLNRNAILAEPGLREAIAGGDPKLLWTGEIGAGWSGFAAVNGYAVTMEQRGDQELVTCYEIATGELKWINAINVRHESFLGGVGPRSTPTIYDGKVFVQGATGVVRCLDGGDGSTIWTDDILKRYGVTPEQDLEAVACGRSGSPLIVDQSVVVPYGGPKDGPYKSLAAYDMHSGELLWTAGQRQVSFSSPMLATVAGVEMILIVLQDFLAAHDPVSGDVLWEHPWPGATNTDANVSQPVVLPGDRILLSKGYGVGGMLLQVTKIDSRWETQQLWANHRVLKTKFTNVVVKGEFAFALSDGILECVLWETGHRQWKSGRFGHGQVLLVNDILIVQAEEGTIHFIEAVGDEMREIESFVALDGKTWNVPCLYGKKLLVRDNENAAFYQL